jgi:hypothetical protein
MTNESLNSGPVQWGEGMKRILVLAVALAAMSTIAASAAETRELHFKSPAPGMSFTAGLPIQVWADIIPRDDDHPGWPQAECYWDGQQVGDRVLGNKKAYDYFPFTVPAAMVTPGVHQLKLKGFGRGGATNPAERSMPVQVDPWPKDKTVVELSADLKAADLNWTNVAVRGNGHTVSVRGKLTIKNSLITGLGSVTILDPSHADPNSVVMVPGITGALTGDVDVEDSVFEATGAMHLAIDGSGDVTIRNNEFRASNLIKFVPSNPGASPVLQLSGKNAKKKLFEGNRIGAGILRFENTSAWLVGGDSDAQSNVLIGPRCVLALANCRDMRVVGNYIHHEYRGTWSQGYNFYCENSERILAEHNVLRASSWPLQSFGGEFRYNLMVDSGHNWVRTLTSGTQFHHNLLVHTGDPYGTGMNAGLWLYNNRTDVAIYNNTFDGGAPVARDFNCPVIALSTGCTLSTLRNNVFTGVAAISRLANNAIVARGGLEKDDGPRVASADYNCFFHPQAPTAASYDPGLVAQKDAGAHDVHADPKFAEGRLIPYSINEADVWNRKHTVSQVLALYRRRYVPAAGSPLLNAGDPADGKGSYIGAIGPGAGAPNDRFGRLSQTADEAPRR